MAPGVYVFGIAGVELRDVIAQVAMPKAAGGQGEETERVHQSVYPPVAEAETCGALIVDEDRGRDGVQAVFADQAVVAQRFDAQQPSVGFKADLPQGGQIAERTADREVVGVVDRRFGAQGLTFFVVLLDLRFLVVDVERRDDALRQHARAETALGCGG